MTDLLARLAARHLGEARLLTPQVPGLFEPQSDSFEMRPEDTVERPPAPRDRTPIADPVPDATPDQWRDAAPVPSDATTPIEIAAVPRDVPKDRIVETHDAHRERHITHETHRDVVGETHRVTHHEHVRAEDERGARPTEPLRQEDHGQVAPAQDPARVPTVTERTLHREPATVAPLPEPVVQALPRDDTDAPRPDVPQPRERRVEVRIGHLEIRTTPPPKPKARPRRNAPNPAPDLDTYLRGRS